MRARFPANLRVLALTALSAAGAGSGLGAAVHQVPGEFSTIQAAIDASSDGEEVLVGPGTYGELLRIEGKALILRSAAGPASTTLDGNDAGPVVYLRNAGATRIEGFTIVRGARIPKDDAWAGGGVQVVNSSPVLLGNVFKQNRWGAAAAVQVFGSTSRAVLEKSALQENEIGVWVEDGASLEVRSCRFDRNGASAWLPGPARLELLDCHFSGWVRATYAANAGVQAFGRGQVRAIQCVFEWLDAGIIGPEHLEVESCLFFELHTAVSVWSSADLLRVRNTIFANNAEAIQITQAVGYPADNLRQDLVTNLVYRRVAYPFGETPDPGPDPLFIDARGGDFRLGRGSPALDAGTPDPALPAFDFAGRPRISGTAIDIGPLEGVHGPGTPLAPTLLEVPRSFPTIQAAIDRALSGDKVLVSPGTYHENLDFLRKAISIESTGGRRVTTITPTDRELPAVQINVNDRGIARISGFAILGVEGSQSGVVGSGDVDLEDLEVRGFSGSGISTSGRVARCISSGNGGGVHISSCCSILPTEIIDCVLEDNGVGISFSAAGTQRIVGNTIRGSKYRALSAQDTSLGLVEGNLFEFNQGGVYFEEVAPSSLYGPLSVRFNTFRGNQAPQGGAIQINTPLELTANVFDGNIAFEWGGALAIRSGGVPMIGNLFARNSAPFGGAVSVELTNPEGFVVLTGNTFADNTSSRDGAGLLVTGLVEPSRAYLKNNVFWGNRSASGVSDIVGVPHEQVRNSDLEEQGFAGTNGNISIDPSFVDAPAGNYHLRADSPCIDRGLPQFAGPPGDEAEWDVGLYDSDRDDRIMDGDGDGIFAPDMGWDEFSPGPAVRVGDCNSSGSVDISDAVAVLGFLYLGAAAPSCLLSCDMNRDDSLDLSDAIAVLDGLFRADQSQSALLDLGRCRLQAPVSRLPCPVSTCR